MAGAGGFEPPNAGTKIQMAPKSRRPSTPEIHRNLRIFGPYQKSGERETKIQAEIQAEFS